MIVQFTMAARIRESSVDGVGIRYVVFVQGCPRYCDGCHNPDTLPFEGGTLTTVDDLLREIQSDPLLSGVTLSGGEPLAQAKAMATLANGVKALGLTVWVYTGYVWEDIVRSDNADWHALLAHTDVLVDGPFEKERHVYGLLFKGSHNQRLIHVPESLTAGTVVLWERT